MRSSHELQWNALGAADLHFDTFLAQVGING